MKHLSLKMRWSMCSAVAWLAVCASAWAIKPADSLLPETTGLYLSIPHVETFRESFAKTQLGELCQDAVMKPFAEDLARQLRQRLGQTETTLGLSLEDLEGVYGGEACLARVQPEGDRTKHATVLLVDVTNHAKELDDVLATVDQRLVARKATKQTQAVGGVSVTTYRLPKKRGDLVQRNILLFQHADQFVATDQLSVASKIIERMKAEHSQGTLSQRDVFQSVTGQLETLSGDMTPHLRWFIDPFIYGEIFRAAHSHPKQGNILQVLRHQGFDAVRGIGGHVNLATGEHEILHRTVIHAPAVPGGEPKYKLAARMLDFANSEHQTSPPWIPRSLSSYLSWNWSVGHAFECVDSLVNEIVGDKDFFEDVLKDFETEANGPQINLRKELIPFLDPHIQVFSDNAFPIGPRSERLIAAVRVNDDTAMEKVIRKWSAGESMREVEVEGHTIWESVPIPEEEIPKVVIGFSGDDAASATESKPLNLSNTAITVAHGHLLVSSDIEFLKEVLVDRPTHDTLAGSADYQLIRKKLAALGSHEDCLQFFSRTDEAYLTAYEMIRNGKMPESQSLLGRLLNRILGPEEKGVLRKQELDGKDLPDFQIVRRYLGPAGLFVQTEPQGWVVTGILASKHEVSAGDGSGAALTSSIPVAGSEPSFD